MPTTWWKKKVSRCWRRNLEQAAVEERPAHAEEVFVLHPLERVLRLGARLLFRQVGKSMKSSSKGWCAYAASACGRRTRWSCASAPWRSTTGLRGAQQAIAVEFAGEQKRGRFAVGPGARPRSSSKATRAPARPRAAEAPISSGSASVSARASARSRAPGSCITGSDGTPKSTKQPISSTPIFLKPRDHLGAAFHRADERLAVEVIVAGAVGEIVDVLLVDLHLADLALDLFLAVVEVGAQVGAKRPARDLRAPFSTVSSR